MCPPAQPPPCEIGVYWSDQQIFSLLEYYSRGFHLPDNVLEDSSPFMYPPSNLPEGMWYLIHSNEERESGYGYWKAKGEACKVYSNNVIYGWRRTLEYFEGLAPDGQLTGWRMQEYSITPKGLSEKHMPKTSRLLCRVFLCSDDMSRSKMNPTKCKDIIYSKNIDQVKSIKNHTNKTPEQEKESELQAKRESEVEALPVVSDTKPNSPPEDFSEVECFSRGDFLELDDLEDPESHSSSSQNSSCPSNLSEECFGSPDFVRDLEEEVEKSIRQERFSSSGYRFSIPVMEDDVVLQRAPSGSSVLCDSVQGGEAETPATSSGADKTLTDKDHEDALSSPKNVQPKNEGTSYSNGARREEKKGGSSRSNKFRSYFCFAAF